MVSYPVPDYASDTAVQTMVQTIKVKRIVQLKFQPTKSVALAVKVAVGPNCSFTDYVSNCQSKKKCEAQELKVLRSR